MQPFLSITVVQIFFLGSLFFTVAALTRKIFVVYVQGAAVFIIYVIGITVFSATRSLPHRPSKTRPDAPSPSSIPTTT